MSDNRLKRTKTQFLTPFCGLTFGLTEMILAYLVDQELGFQNMFFNFSHHINRDFASGHTDRESASGHTAYRINFQKTFSSHLGAKFVKIGQTVQKIWPEEISRSRVTSSCPRRPSCSCS